MGGVELEEDYLGNTGFSIQIFVEKTLSFSRQTLLDGGLGVGVEEDSNDNVSHRNISKPDGDIIETSGSPDGLGVLGPLRQLRGLSREK